MQDKEFDDLFRSKLENFEHEPSAGVWAGVTSGLEKKPKRSIAPLLGIAASIVVLVTAGILFIPHTARINIKPQAQNKTPEVARQNVPDKADSVSPDAENLTAGNAPKEKAAAKPAGRQRSRNNAPVVQSYAVDSVKNVVQQFMASTPQQHPEEIEAIVPDKSTQIAIKQSPMPTEAPVFKTQPAVANAQLPQPGKQDTATGKPGHKIHTFGDLVNVVVAKLDKRKEKIIEFSDTDGDRSTITGLNLGIIKIKKDK